MSNAVFPDLIGVDIKVRKTPIWNTKIKTAVSGKELRASFYSTPLYKFGLSFNVLRAGAEAELQTLVGFFNDRRGRFDSFLFDDASDNAVTAQSFGVGDGLKTKFQLVRTFGGNVESVMNLNGTPSISQDGVPLTPATDYTIDAYGMVTLAAPPLSSAVLTWTGTYYYRCRFDRDTVDFERFLWDLWEAKRIELLGSLGTKI
jgi:uncharacterized protein (TIGR02217 family)